MMVGNNETHYAWQDEGLTTYVENLSLKDQFPDAEPFAETMRDYLRIAGADFERPSMREADLYGAGPQYGVATYAKPGMLFRALAAVIGERTLHNALRVYASRWLLKHPSPWDLFHTIEDVAGRKLDWFWTPWFYDTAVLDQAIVAVEVRPVTGAAGGEHVTIMVEDQGDAPMPVPIMLTTIGGDTTRIELPVQPWLDGKVRQMVTVELAAPVQRIEIDPERHFPDVERADNIWVRERSDLRGSLGGR
jgi:aminopeptidase N